MAETRVGINGFGRIGKCMFRAAQDRDDITVAAANDVQGPDYVAEAAQYDTVHGRYDADRDGDTLVVDGDRTPVYAEDDPAALPWDDEDVDVALESTGVFRHRDDAAQHLEAGADTVIISAPPKGDDHVPQFVYGVNHQDYSGEDVVSNASCTTNSVAPLIDVLDGAYGFDAGTLISVHAVTDSQNLKDGYNPKKRRQRNAMDNVVPTTTGAADAVGEVLPAVADNFDAMSPRIPVSAGSASFLTCTLDDDPALDAVNDTFRAAARGAYSDVIGYVDDADATVSSDIVTRPESVIFDADTDLQLAADGDGSRLYTVFGWYDNEFGYANRMLDMAGHVHDA